MSTPSSKTASSRCTSTSSTAVDTAFYESKAAEWRKAQLEAKANIDEHEHANQAYLEQRVMLLELASRSHELFAAQAPLEKRRLLDFVLQNCTWKAGVLTPTYRQPFDMIAESSAASRNAKAGGVTPDGQFARMLGFVDTYRTLCLAPPSDIRDSFEQLRSFRAAA